jgi:predicted Zn-dependent peptidase
MTKVEHFKLSNDLPVILIDMPEVPSAAIGFMTKVGQRDGGLAKAEISHVLEHLLFDGTKELPDRTDVSVAIDEIGAEFEGGTWEEYTGFYLKVEPRSFERSVFILSQMIIHSVLKGKELGKEKQIILQELSLREDDPIIKITDFLQETLFPNHPLGCSREFAKKSLPKLTQKDLFSHWQRNYVSGSSVLVICGDRKKLESPEKLAEEYFSGFKKGEREPLETIGKDHQGWVRIVDKKTAQVHFALGMRGYSLGDERVYASRLLDIIFGHSFSSRLYQEIREKRKLAYALFSSVDFYQDTGTCSVYAGVDRKRLEEAVAAVIEEMKKIADDKKEGITEDELKKAKNYLRGRMAVQMDNPANQFVFYAKRYLFDREIIEPTELIKRYQKVQKDELVQIARDLFRPEKINLVAMGSGIDEKKLANLLR